MGEGPLGSGTMRNHLIDLLWKLSDFGTVRMSSHLRKTPMFVGPNSFGRGDPNDEFVRMSHTFETHMRQSRLNGRAPAMA
jgi:hypothetical protein